MAVSSNSEMESYLRDMDGVVLYDVFYEAGTILSGVLVAIEREYRRQGDTESAEKICNEDIALIKERAAVEPHDIDKQIACKIAWTKKTAEMRDVLHTLKGDK